MSSSSPSLSARSASTSASKITSASQEHRINTYLTQHTAHTKGVEGLIAFLDGHASSSAATQESAGEDGLRTPPSSDRQREALQPAFRPSPSIQPHVSAPQHRGADMQQDQRNGGQKVAIRAEGGEDSHTTPSSHSTRSPHNGEAYSPVAASPIPVGGRPSLDSTKSEIERLQQEVSSIQNLMHELQSSITSLCPPASGRSPYAHPSSSLSAPSAEIASPEYILSFIRHVDSLANLRHRSGDMRRDEDIFTKNNLQKLGVRIDAWEKIARNR